MRVIETTVYNFDELSDKAKQNALSEQQNINFNGDWWDLYYESAMGTEHFKITSFDLGRGGYVTGTFYSSALDTAKAIIMNHGIECDSHILASQFIKEFDNNKTVEENEDLEQGFKEGLLATHHKGLNQEMEYKYSDVAIIEAINANDIEFLECGTEFRH